jgi:hypothetical protein
MCASIPSAAPLNRSIALAHVPSLAPSITPLQGARCHVGTSPPRGKEQQSYSFSAQLRTLLKGLTLTGVRLAAPFERVIALEFAQRLTDAEPTHR